MLEIKGLTLRYGQSQILNGIDLTASPGHPTSTVKSLNS